jgi:TPR repeat protein
MSKLKRFAIFASNHTALESLPSNTREGFRMRVLFIAAALGSFAFIPVMAIQQEQAQQTSAVDLDAAKRLGAELTAKAESGNAAAQSSLGVFSELAKDYSLAAFWYRKAANQGDVIAQGNLGRLYHAGLGVPQDFAEAYHWARSAADKGDPLGELLTGLLNLEGKGRPTDYAEAVSWLRRAAEQDCSAKGRLEHFCGTARFSLGTLYDAGEGVPQDYVLAHMWTNLASAALEGEGQKSAARFRDSIAAKMTPQQIAQAQQLAREWRPGQTR